jgi:hypothetical protein
MEDMGFNNINLELAYNMNQLAAQCENSDKFSNSITGRGEELQDCLTKTSLMLEIHERGFMTNTRRQRGRTR